MAAKTKSNSALLTNSTARKEKARKAGKCQRCGTKTKGRSVYTDYDKQKVIKTQLGKPKDGYAFYCDDCADRKVTRMEWKLAQRTSSAKPKRSRKRGAAAKEEKPKRKRASRAKAGGAKRKRTTAKGGAKKGGARKRKAATANQASAEPF